jgi:energy-coupling factor transport system substrate-specific component
MLISSALYALAIYLTAILNIPGSDNVQIRPGVAVPIVAGVLFGPAVGFVSGFVGNLAADQFLDWGWWPFWYLGNGLMGFVSGLFRPRHPDYTRLSTVSRATSRAIVGAILGMGIASLSERWITQSSWSDILWINFLPAVLSNVVNAVILVPIILMCYGMLREATALEHI